MPDREKVIKWLDVCKKADRAVGLKEDYPCRECPYKDSPRCMRELIADAIALLKEQEAKQIVRKQCKKEHDDGSIDYFAEWYCPHCNLLILRGFDNPSIKFCYKCGKPILWEGRGSK